MDSGHYFKIEDLQRLCDEHEEESLRLEFKSCNELKVGSHDYESGTSRSKDKVLNELTKDVTAFLNSTGGTIIYGIREKKSRADEIDKANSFKGNDQDNVWPEKVIDWLRDNIQPPPTVDVYRVFEKDSDPQSSWYLVIEIPQGQQAYMTRDHRFYKRVGATVKLMEQYEVSDVMNRTRAAVLDWRMKLHNYDLSNRVWNRLRLDIEVTSTNFVASEYGALKLTIAYPLRFMEGTPFSFRGSYFERSTGLSLGGELDPSAESLMVRWGAALGNVVFPGDWYNFYGNGFIIDMPSLAFIPSSTYLFQIELFTNGQSKKDCSAPIKLDTKKAFLSEYSPA
jgi:hypothetical protein